MKHGHYYGAYSRYRNLTSTEYDTVLSYVYSTRGYN